MEIKQHFSEPKGSKKKSKLKIKILKLIEISIAYQNPWNATKAVLREKFKVIMFVPHGLVVSHV